MNKTMLNKLRESFFKMCTSSWDNNITVFVRVESEDFDLKIVNIVVSLVW